MKTKIIIIAYLAALSNVFIIMGHYQNNPKEYCRNKVNEYCTKRNFKRLSETFWVNCQHSELRSENATFNNLHITKYLETVSDLENNIANLKNNQGKMTSQYCQRAYIDDKAIQKYLDKTIDPNLSLLRYLFQTVKKHQSAPKRARDLHLHENLRYLEELCFLTEQDAKIDLLWNLQKDSLDEMLQKAQIPHERESIVACYNNQQLLYNNQKEALKKEIESFKNPNNRRAFTRSCLSKDNFVLVSACRERYNKKIHTKE